MGGIVRSHDYHVTSLFMHSQEKDVREAELAQLTSNYESLTNEKAELEETLRELRLQSEGQAKRGEELEAELVKMQSETKTQKEEIAEKNKMILKVSIKSFSVTLSLPPFSLFLDKGVGP